MKDKIIVEKLRWHDCPVDSITFNARAQTLDLLLDPSEEMLEALGMKYPQTNGFKVIFTGVSSAKLSQQFRFFEKREDVWIEVLHADFEEKDNHNICNLGAILYDKRSDAAAEGYGEVTFEYNHAFVEQIVRE